jgi:uncharacterized protein YceK
MAFWWSFDWEERMTGRRLAVGGFLPFLLMSCGCGTFWNTAWATPFDGQRPYGGVRDDVESARRLVTTPAPHETPQARARGTVLALLDVPFSVVGDTLTLPYILWVRDSDRRAGPDEPRVSPQRQDINPSE